MSCQGRNELAFLLFVRAVEGSGKAGQTAHRRNRTKPVDTDFTHVGVMVSNHSVDASVDDEAVHRNQRYTAEVAVRH